MSKFSHKTNKVHLGELESFYIAGDRNALIKAIRHCGNEKIVMPDWVVEAFFQATNDWYRLKVKTLDEAFDLIWPKGKQFPAAQKAKKISASVYRKVLELKNSSPIDEYLFEQVGDEFGIGKTKASEYYYSWKRWLESIDTIEIK